MNNIAEVNILRSTQRSIFTAVSRLLTRPRRLRLRFSAWWSTGVDGRELGGRFMVSKRDKLIPAGSIAAHRSGG